MTAHTSQSLPHDDGKEQMEIAAKVTSKGQITITKSVREALSLETGDTVVFRVQSGRATMARTPALLELAGSIEVPAAARGMAWSEIVERTHRAVADDFEPKPMGGATGFLDTNVLVRHLTGEPSDAAPRATRTMAGAAALFVPDLVLAELAYVLEKHYRAPRSQVAEALRSVLAFPAVRTVDPDALLRTIEVFEVHQLDFADAYLVASAEASGVGTVVSFDRGIDHVGTVERISP